MLLPNAAPAARSGALAIVIELIPVANSGNEVAVASRTIPTNVWPSPIFVAILLEALTRNFDDNRINNAAANNCIHRRVSKVC